MTHVITAAANLFGVALALVAAVIGYFHGIGTVAVIFRSVTVGFAAALLVRFVGVMVVKMLVAQAERAEAARRRALSGADEASERDEAATSHAA